MNSNEKNSVATNAKYSTAQYAAGGEYVMIRLKGKMVYETSDEFSKELAQQVKEKQQYIIDVNELERLDSTGLGVLITFAKKIQGAGGHLAFVVHKKFLQDIFKIAKFDYIFPVSATQEEAWQALKSGYAAKMKLTNY